MPQKVTELFPESSRVLALASFRFDPAQMLLSDGSGNLIKLRAQTGRVLKHLAEHAGKPVTKADLIEAVWPQKFVTDDSLTQCISELRRKLEDKDHRIIETFTKIGYQLNCTEDNRFEADGEDGARQLNLVIRPFEDVSTEAERGYLGNAITEEVSVGLSQCCDFSLVAVPRGSDGDDISILAKKHHIHYVLDGSQQKIDNRIRVTARLIDAHSQQNIWAKVYERDLDVSRAGQMEIVEHIVTAAGAEMSEGLPSGGLVENCAVYLNLKSRPLARRLNRDDNLRAKELNIKAVEIDPQSPFGHLGQAVYYHLECAFNWCKPADRADYLKQGILHAHRAIELDRYNETGHRICALLHLQQGDRERALQRLSASLKINPNRPLERGHMADMLSFSRQTGIPVDDIKNAISVHDQMDSLHCWILWRDGNYQQVLAKLQARTGVPAADNLILAATYAGLGRAEEARQAAQIYLAEFPEFSLAQAPEMAMAKYCTAEDLDRWFNALRKSGVPDTARTTPLNET